MFHNIDYAKGCLGGRSFPIKRLQTMPIGVAKQADNCYVPATRDFRHLDQGPSVRFWAGTLAGLAFCRVRFSGTARG
jgi:hypothetical protein